MARDSELDIQAAGAQYEAMAEEHRELEAIPKSVCLECTQPWPCDAVELASFLSAALEALEEAQGKLEAVRAFAQTGCADIERDGILRILSKEGG